MNQNENTHNSVEIDPDYESTNTAIRNVELKEEEDNQLTVDKIKKLLQEEFDHELQERQKQLEEIEEKIFKARKLLHVVRYVLISSYYNNKALEHEKDGTASLEYSNILSGQNRIHPAIKKLLGTNVNNFKFLDGRTKRKIPPKNDHTIAEEPEVKKIKLDVVSVPEKVEIAPPVKAEPSVVESKLQEVATQRMKVQHKIVIGNISYFKKSLEQDNLTHKWMVYVKIFRGTKQGPEVSESMISKVFFCLHPSYKPHDVVEVCNPPFHLSRRGWGEFPLRVKIFFKSPRNKPVDIIHKLKLDKTFTERQTLGNETIETVFLYDDHPVKELNSIIILQDNSAECLKQEASTSSEHDYCYESVNSNKTAEVKLNNNNNNVKDHSYSMPSAKDSQKVGVKKQKSPIKQPYNELIYGLGPNYLDPNKSKSRRVRSKINNSPEKDPKNVFKVLKTVTGQSIKFLPESFSQILLGNGNVVSVKFLKQQPASSTNNRQIDGQNIVRHMIDQEKYMLQIPNLHFKCMGEALPYLFKRIPLWAQDATDSKYKSVYPFMACSQKEYQSWNVGKRLSSEWSRAKAIKRILSSETYSKNWSTKAIFMYGRSHLYTPTVPSYKLFRNESPEKRLILNCFESDTQNGYPDLAPVQIKEENVNIISPEKVIPEPNTVRKSYVDGSNKSLAQECAYVKETALDVGIILKSEELVPGVLTNASERVLLEAVKCFAENLIRRSQNFLICDGDYRESNAVITTDEVRRALDERKEFQTITKFRESKMTMDFFS
ncbi:YEATS domain-containing protein 2-like [Sitophilus oryzae]|uniref:YEATS domain-containing protein 2-like n=1 Tax=Sitophilus oryzae TaxID=7048 RepID=A0A6J2X7H0_SITOR|nr:YEATS domain-containing protein 2-like [Sitophilus oryzae]